MPPKQSRPSPINATCVPPASTPVDRYPDPGVRSHRPVETGGSSSGLDLGLARPTLGCERKMSKTGRRKSAFRRRRMDAGRRTRRRRILRRYWRSAARGWHRMGKRAVVHMPRIRCDRPTRYRGWSASADHMRRARRLPPGALERGCQPGPAVRIVAIMLARPGSDRSSARAVKAMKAVTRAGRRRRIRTVGGQLPRDGIASVTEVGKGRAAP